MSRAGLPLDSVPDDEVLEIQLGRPVSSVYDVVALYGRINSLIAAERVEGDVSAEYVPYMTPDNDKIQDLYDKDNTLLNVHVDLAGDEPRLADELVTLERLTWQKAVQTGYTRPIKKRGAIIAHSIPHHANGKDPETTAKYAVERLTRWPTNDEITKAVPDSDGMTVIEHLQDLGEDEDVREEIKEAVKERVETIGGTFEGLVSLRIKREPDGEFRYPGEIDMINEGMIKKKADRMKGYSSAKNSSGTAADYVTGELETAFGATPGSPVEYFHGKQLEKFPNMDPDRGYQVRPLSEATAADVASGNAYTAACSVYYGGGVEIRYLPYLDAFETADDVRRLAELLTTALEGSQSFRELLVDRLRERSRFAERLRLWQVVVATDLDEKNKIVADRGGIEALRALDIADRHIELLDAWPHVATDWRGVFRGGTGDSDHLSLLDRENTGIPQSILSGRYFGETLHNPQAESEDPVFGPDDVRLQSLIALVSQEPLPVAQIRQSAVTRIIKEQNDLLGDADTDREFPFYLVAKQHVQFSALAACNALSAEAGLPYITSETTMPETTDSRENRLEQFINDHPVLEDPERRTAFLLGALVGRLSAYQMQEGVSTMVSRYPVEYITKRNIPRIVTKVLGKNAEYSEKEDKTGLMNMRYQHRLSDLLHQTEPESWSLSTDEVRMHYSLGIAYGYGDTSADDESDGEAEQEPAAAQS